MLRKLAEKGRPCMWIDVADHASLQQSIDVARKARRVAYPALLAPKYISLVQYVGVISSSTLNVIDFISFCVILGEGLILNIFAFKCIIHNCLEAYLQV